MYFMLQYVYVIARNVCFELAT